MRRASETLDSLVSEGPTHASLQRRPGVVVFGAGKGGVGTSTVTALTGRFAAAGGRRVLLVDGDESVGSLHLLLGVRRPGPGIGALRRPGVGPDELLISVGEGIDLISGGGGGVASTTSAGIAERRILFRRLRELYEHYDLVLVDGGSRVESVLAAMSGGLERVAVVTALDRISLAGTFAFLKLLRRRFADPPVAIVLNGGNRRSRDEAWERLREGLELFQHARASRLPDVPALPALRKPNSGGSSLLEVRLEKREREAFRRLIEALVSTDPSTPTSVMALSEHR